MVLSPKDQQDPSTKVPSEDQDKEPTLSNTNSRGSSITPKGRGTTRGGRSNLITTVGRGRGTSAVVGARVSSIWPRDRPAPITNADKRRTGGSTPVESSSDGSSSTTATEVMELLKLKAIPGVDGASRAGDRSSMCYPGTRVPQLNKIIRLGRTRAPPLFWITGPARCGKSTIARTLTEWCKKRKKLGAALFLYEAENHSEAAHIIPTIAYQLVNQNQRYKDFLVSVFSEDPTIFEKPISEQFRKLLLDTSWTQQSEGQHTTVDPLVIILDGLEDCRDGVARQEFIDMINRHLIVPQASPFLWVVCSRKETRLEDSLAKLDKTVLSDIHIDLPIDDLNARKEVAWFLRDGFANIRRHYYTKFGRSEWPTEAQSLRVEEASSGFFPFAECILRFVRDKEHEDPIGRLAICLYILDNPTPSTVRLFEPLDVRYVYVLSSAGKKSLPTTLDILRFCASNSSGGSCTVSSILSALGITKAHFYHAVYALHSVLDIPPRQQAEIGSLGFYHSSFLEFLQDPSRSGKYTIKRDPQSVPTLRAAKSVTTLSDAQSPETNTADVVLDADTAKSSKSLTGPTVADDDSIGDKDVASEHIPPNDSVTEIGSVLSVLPLSEGPKDHLEVTISLLSRVLKMSPSRNALLALKDDQAQLMVDYLHSILLEPSLPLPWLRKHSLIALRDLCKASFLYPRCYVLKDIDRGSPESGGAFSDIYKGRHGEGHLCLKVVRLFQKNDTSAMLRIYAKEAILWGQLHHPNVAPFYGIYYLNEERKQVCLVSPWMNNGNLVEYLENNSSAPRSPFIYDVVAGLEYLHEQNLIHSDIKGMNILVNDSERACITDFGVSSIRTDQTLAYTLKATTVHGFSHRWAAPELLEENALPTLASDVWALGCVFYEVLTGSLPFGKTPDTQIFLKLSKGERPAKPDPTPDTDSTEAAIWELIDYCWALEPEERPTCSEMAQELKRKGITREQGDSTDDSAQRRQDFQNAMRKNEEVPLDLGKVEQILEELCTSEHTCLQLTISSHD